MSYLLFKLIFNASAINLFLAYTTAECAAHHSDIAAHVLASEIVSSRSSCVLLLDACIQLHWTINYSFFSDQAS